MRKFIDLGVYPGESQAESMIETATRLGYGGVGLRTGVESSIDVVKRVNLEPRNQNELGKQVRKHRYEKEVIFVFCSTKSVSRQAAKDHRVDLVRFPLSGGRRQAFLDRQQAGLMRDSGVGYEVQVRDLLIDDRYQLLKRIGIIKRSLDIALKYDLPVVASSGATSVYELRDPHGLASLLSLLGVEIEQGLDAVSDTPCRIVTENRAKLSENFVEPGVWIMDE